jgi:hypothetical protein
LRKDVVVLRTSMKMLAGIVAAGAVLSACGPVRLGAAVVTRNGRISSETLSANVSDLNKGLAVYGGRVALQFPESQKPQEVLSWLIRFKVGDELASRYGIKVTPGEAQAAKKKIQQSAAQGQSSGAAIPFQALAVANGLPVNQLPSFYRYEALQTVIETRISGGTLPAGNAALQALTTKFATAECRAAKVLDIKVSPQYGRLDYNGFTVVSDPSALSAAEPSATPSPSPSASASSKPQYRPAC